MGSAAIRRIESAVAWPLHGSDASRRIEQDALATLAPHALMRRAGESVARLALALAPHAHRVWVAAGPGNNGGDGLEAAVHLLRAGRIVSVTLLGDAARLPDDARDALSRAQAAGVSITDTLPDRDDAALALDALLGIGARRAPDGAMAEVIRRLNACAGPVVSIDLPSGLHPDTGQPLGTDAVQARHTLSLLTLKPGLYTGRGRDHAGVVWLDTLGVVASRAPDAMLAGQPVPLVRPHASHKGRFGDVLVVGGDRGMTGAAVLAAAAALALGAGRVYVALLRETAMPHHESQPELMFRDLPWALAPDTLAASTVVCGCGGGEAVHASLPSVLHHAARLVLDADALNAVARDAALLPLVRSRAARGLPTVATPHPLEAARLLARSATEIQNDRLAAARAVAEHLDACVLLKGSGTVVAARSAVPLINPTGNGLLASAGTGDVLAGAIAALWSADPALGAEGAAAAAAWLHGAAADHEAERGLAMPLTASRLVAAMCEAAWLPRTR